MPRFEPFRALRYSSSGHLDKVVAPPADVIGKKDVQALRELDQHNISWVQYPNGGKKFQTAAYRLEEWESGAHLTRETVPSLTIYRIAYRTETGDPRQLSGVVGALELDEDSFSLAQTPREQDISEQLELLQVSGTELEPTWAMADAKGLQAALHESGELIGRVQYGDVVHTIERIIDPDRIELICRLISRSDVTLAAGVHNFKTALEYRKQIRAITGSRNTAAEFTMAFVTDLHEQSVEFLATHRYLDGLSHEKLRKQLSGVFTFEPFEGPITRHILNEMVALDRLVLVSPNGNGTWLVPRPGAFTGVRKLDSAWLEHAFAGSFVELSTQPNFDWLLADVRHHKGAILVRPASAEDYLEAIDGDLAPAETVALSPRPYAGMVLRPTVQVSSQNSK